MLNPDPDRARWLPWSDIVTRAEDRDIAQRAPSLLPPSSTKDSWFLATYRPGYPYFSDLSLIPFGPPFCFTIALHRSYRLSRRTCGFSTSFSLTRWKLSFLSILNVDVLSMYVAAAIYNTTELWSWPTNGYIEMGGLEQLNYTYIYFNSIILTTS